MRQLLAKLTAAWKNAAKTHHHQAHPWIQMLSHETPQFTNIGFLKQIWLTAKPNCPQKTENIFFWTSFHFFWTWTLFMDLTTNLLEMATLLLDLHTLLLDLALPKPYPLWIDFPSCILIAILQTVQHGRKHFSTLCGLVPPSHSAFFSISTFHTSPGLGHSSGFNI